MTLSVSQHSLSTLTAAMTLPLPPPPPPLIHAVSGAIGGALALILLYPLERIRIEMQRQLKIKGAHSSTMDDVETIGFTPSPVKQRTFNNAASSSSSSPNEGMLDELWSFETANKNIGNSSDETGACNNDDSANFHDAVSEEMNHEHYDTQQQIHPRHISTTTMLSCFRTLLQQQQNELYRGITPVVTTLAISNFIFFYMNEYFKNHLFVHSSSSSSRVTSRYRSLLASCLAGICNVLITNPLWVTNIRITTGEATYNSLIAEMRHTIQQHNNSIQHLWSGTVASLLLVTNPVIQFFVYEEFKTLLCNKRRLLEMENIATTAHRHQITPMQAFAIGAIAKTIATLLTYPIQVAQSLLRMQEKTIRRSSNNKNQTNKETYDSTKECPSQPKGVTYTGTSDCLVQLYQQNGVTALYTGIRAKLLQTVLTAAFTFVSYEQIVQVLYRIYQSSYVVLQKQQ